jgi:hypothetical protein
MWASPMPEHWLDGSPMILRMRCVFQSLADVLSKF